MFQNETPEARDRRLGKMTGAQKRGVALFVAIWLGSVAAIVAVPTAAVIGLLFVLNAQ